MKKILTAALTIGLVTSFAQKVVMQEADSRLDENHVFLGSGEDEHFFSHSWEVHSYNDRGQEKNIYRTPFILRFDGQTTRDCAHVIWNGLPYYIARTGYSSSKPIRYILFKMNPKDKLSEEDGAVFASIQLPEKAGSVEHQHRTFTKIVDGELYIANLLYGNTKRDNFPINIVVTKIDKDLKATTLVEEQVENIEIKGLYDFAFDGKTLCFSKVTRDNHHSFGHLDIANKKYTESKYRDVDNLSRHFVYDHFLHPTTGEIFELGGAYNSDGEAGFVTRKISDSGRKIEVSKFNPMQDLPSAGFSTTVKRQWSSGSRFSDNISKDVVSSMILEDTYVDANDNIIAVYEIYIYNSWTDKNGTDADAIGLESVVRSINPVSLEENWRVVIPKIQEPEDLMEMLGTVENAHYVGIISYPYKNGVLIAYNDNAANGKARLNKSNLQPWKKLSHTSIIGVYIDPNGKAKKTILSRTESLALLPLKGKSAYPNTVRLNEIKDKPLIFGRRKRDTYIGLVK